jgi:hypothetical protein
MHAFNTLNLSVMDRQPLLAVGYSLCNTLVQALFLALVSELRTRSVEKHSKKWWDNEYSCTVCGREGDEL